MCLKGIKLGGVHKIVLHNAKSALRGSDMVLCAFLLSSPFLHSILHFTGKKKRGPSSQIMCLVCLSDNRFFAKVCVCMWETQKVITEASVREFPQFCLQPHSVIKQLHLCVCAHIPSQSTEKYNTHYEALGKVKR